ncbi:spore coat protein [Shouchella sp. JSM 1781072]|uniref:spore coat protein n=1 Tax=Bacillaceae TaxID=186817 RepID=UPI000C06AC83|nr:MULTISPECIES: spore coat protein [Bacillaceae]UTR05666.1 spore coat protein [Alkalihalobacillus sp. LMS6]
MQPPYRYVRNMPHDYRRPYGYGYGRRPRPFYGGGNALLGGFVGGLGGALVAPYLFGGPGYGYGYGGGYPPYGYPPYGGGYYY